MALIFLNSVMTIRQLMDYLGFNKNVIVIDYNGTLYLEKGFGNKHILKKRFFRNTFNRWWWLSF